MDSRYRPLRLCRTNRWGLCHLHDDDTIFRLMFALFLSTIRLNKGFRSETKQNLQEQRFWGANVPAKRLMAITMCPTILNLDLGLSSLPVAPGATELFIFLFISEPYQSFRMLTNSGNYSLCLKINRLRHPSRSFVAKANVGACVDSDISAEFSLLVAQHTGNNW